MNVYQGGALVEVVTKEYAREEAHHRVRHPLLTYSAMRAFQYQGRIQSMSQ